MTDSAAEAELNQRLLLSDAVTLLNNEKWQEINKGTIKPALRRILHWALHIENTNWN